MKKNMTFHKRKIWVVLLCCILMMTGLIGRLVYLMCFRSDYYYKKAKELHEREREIKAARGEILDAKGKVLASNSCEKRDSADAVVVRNAIDLSSCNLSGLSAGAILNCGSASYFQHVHLPESAENSQLRILPAPDYVTGSFRRPVGILAPTAFA